MLTRLYVDNFRSFDSFEYRLDRLQIIFGANGSGKSSFADALLLIRQIAIVGAPLDDYNLLIQRTRWLSRAALTFELEAELDGLTYIYKFVVQPAGDPPQASIALETLHLAGEPLFRFESGDVHLFNDQFEESVVYPFDPLRSAFATISPRQDNQRLTRFKMWLSSLFCFRINPFALSGRAESENLWPNANLSNLASWYRHLVQVEQKRNFVFTQALPKVLDGFKFLALEPVGENVRLMIAEFGSGGSSAKYVVNELSEGQRCLICLYAILHFLLAKGCTVLIDEPDNFISLREIQPWLTAVSDVVGETPAQVILISHHPEIIDQWAPAYGTHFIREDGGRTCVQPFPLHDGSLQPSELIARGWLD